MRVYKYFGAADISGPTHLILWTKILKNIHYIRFTYVSLRYMILNYQSLECHELYHNCNISQSISNVEVFPYQAAPPFTICLLKGLLCSCFTASLLLLIHCIFTSCNNAWVLRAAVFRFKQVTCFISDRDGMILLSSSKSRFVYL